MKIKKIIKDKLTKTIKEKVVIPSIEGHYLENRCALITGGSSGIGYSIAESFLKNGATVIITGRNVEKLENARKNLIENCNCKEDRIYTGILDILKVDAIENSFIHITNQLNKRIDIFVNNAGVNGKTAFPLTPEEEYDTILDTNLKGMYFMSQVIVNYMINNKIQGNILNVTSSSSLRPGISPYIIRDGKKIFTFWNNSKWNCTRFNCNTYVNKR